jgi:hypothetical protein
MIFCFSAFGQNAEELLKQVDSNLMPESYVAYRKIIDTEPSGKKKEYSVYQMKKGADKMALLFLSPASEKDRSMLRVGDNWWLYIPSVGRPIRQTSLQSVTGGIFDNGDILALDFSVEYTPTIAADDGVQYILDLWAKTKNVTYAYVKMYVRKEGLTVMKIECYAPNKMLLKTIEFTDIKDFGNGLIRPSVLSTTSPLHKGYQSMMVFTAITPKALGDEVFTLQYMPKLKGLAR